METLLPSQPESYKQLIRRSFLLYRKSFSKIILLSFLLSVVVFIPRLLSNIIGQDIFANISPFSPHRLWLVVIDLVSLTCFIGILWHMHCVVVRLHEPLVEDFLVGIKKVIYVFIAAIIQSTIVFAVVMLIYGIQILLHEHHLLFGKNLLGILFTVFVFFSQLAIIVYVSTLFCFFIPIIAIENKGIITSLERSVSLVWNHWWRTFSVQLTPWFSYLILLLIIKYVFRLNIHIYFMEYDSHSNWITCLYIILFTLFIPWAASLMIIQLKDLELRKKLTQKRHEKRRKNPHRA
jgi:hypothetical protein